MPTISLKFSQKDKANEKVEKKHKILVAVGEKVEKDQEAVEVEETELVQVGLSQQLGVSQKDIVKCLLVKKGDKINNDQVLAQKKHLFSTKTLKSPIRGEVYDINTTDGTVVIRVTKGKKVIKSPVRGEVVEKTSQEIKIKFDGYEFTGEKGWGDKRGILKLVETENEHINLFGLTRQDNSAIVLGNIWSKDALAKAEALECGVVGVSFPEGWESLKMTFATNDNFAILEVNLETFSQLKNFLGKEVYLKGELGKIFYQ